ncbi:MAG: hypothetical protein AB1689_29260 [Thermodesulfobacteriota bacterium]
MRIAAKMALLLAGATLIDLRPAGAQCIPEPLEYAVAPNTTDPAIDTDLERHLAVVNPALPLRPELVVWFSGSGGRPRSQRRFLREAAAAGYRVIGVNYPNFPSVRELCNPQQPEDPACYENVRLERLDGTDRGPLVDVSPANGITNRIVKLLAYLDAQQPDQGWGEFLDGETPRWERFIVAGHSQGGGMAAIIGKQHEVARVLMLSWKDILSLLTPAPWLSAAKQTPGDRYYGLSHQHSSPVPEEAAWDALGLPGTTVDVDVTPGPFAAAHRLTTDVLPQSGDYEDAHGSVVVDGATPLRADGTPLLSDVWRYMLGAMPTAVTPVRTSSLTLKDGSTQADSRKRSVSFRSATRSDPPESQVVLPALGGPGDPTVSGAVLRLFNSEYGGEVASVVLPAAGWKALGSPARPQGYAFTDRNDGAPLRMVTVRASMLSLRGGKEGWCFTLDEPQQGRIGIGLTLGTGLELCADAPARATGSPPSTAANDRVDRFVAAPNTPAPAACPLAPRPPLPPVP